MIGGFGHVDRWLSEWLDGTLPAPRREAVERHLESCARCRARAGLLRGTVDSLRALETAAPPPGFVERVRERVVVLAAAGLPGGAGDRSGGEGDEGAYPGPAPAGEGAADAAPQRPSEPPYPAGGLREWLTRRGRWQPAAAAAALLILLVWAAGRFLGGSGATGDMVVGSGGGGMAGEQAVGAPNAVGQAAGEEAGRAADGSAPGTDQAAGGAIRGGEPGTGRPPADAAGRMLIRTGRLDMTVPDVEAAYREAQLVARRHGGFVQNARLDSAGPVRTASLTLRVPDERLETVMEELAGLAQQGRVDGRFINSDDISQQYVDTRARLENLRAQEARLRELTSRAASVEELLRVEQELWRVRGEIEQLEGLIRFWDQAVRLATVEVSLQGAEVAPPEPGGTVWERARRAFLQSLLRLGRLAQGAVVLAAGLLPYLAVAGVGVGAWAWWRRRGPAA